jgi:hypothetical protein
MNTDGTNAYDLTPLMPNARYPDWQRLPVTERSIGGKLEPINILTTVTQLIIGISAIAATIGIALKKKKRI